jgi:coronin-7
LPSDGITEEWREDQSAGVLEGHNNGIRTLNFHPTADNILATTAMDSSMKIWDLTTQSEQYSIDFDCAESMANLSWNFDGSMAAVMGKDRIIRIVDPRQQQVALSSTPELRSGQLVWVSNKSDTDAIIVCGVKGGQRQITSWDPRSLSGPTVTRQIDNSSGQLFPIYDEDCQVLYVTGKSDTTIRIYELTLEGGACLINHANDFQSSGEGMKGLAMLPKRSCDIRNVEVASMVRLSGDTVTPLRFTLPRSEALKAYFQDDIFVPTRSHQPPMEADEWLVGFNVNPEYYSLQPAGMTPLSEKPPEEVKVSTARVMREQIHDEEQKEKEKEAVFSKLQNMAIQRSKFHPNKSMGVKGVDAVPIHDSDDSDDDWDD